MEEIYKYIHSDGDTDYYTKATYYMLNIGKVKVVNIIINFILAYICIFIFKYSIFKIILTMLIYDVVMYGLERLIIKLHEKKYHEIDIYKREKYLKKLKEIELKIIKGDLKFNYNISESYQGDNLNNKCKNIRNIREIINDFEKTSLDLREKYKGYDKDKEKIYTVTAEYSEIINEVERKIKEFCVEDYVKDVIKNSRDLIREMKVNPGSYRVVDKIINIYLIELLEIITSIDRINIDEKDKYIVKMEELVEAYNDHITNEIKTVKTFNRKAIESSIKTLLEELKEGEKE